MPHSLLALILFSFAAHAGAQVHKTVGPDGKVSYSDQPPPTAAAPAKAVQDARVRGAAGPSAPAGERTLEEWKAFAAAKRAAAVAGVRGPAPLTAQAQDRQAALGQRLAPGMTLAIRNTSLTREASSMCVRFQPDAQRRIRLAQQAWEARNAPVIKRTYEVLAQYFPRTDRAQADTMALTDAYATLREVMRTSPAQRNTWCAQFGASMAAGRADLVATQQVALMMRLTD